MPVFRVDKRREFTVIANSVFKDRTLSAKAKGLLAEMLSLPETWDYTMKGLASLFSDGEDSIRQGIRELEEHGYIVRERKRDEKGRLSAHIKLIKRNDIFWEVIADAVIRSKLTCNRFFCRKQISERPCQADLIKGYGQGAARAAKAIHAGGHQGRADTDFP